MCSLSLSRKVLCLTGRFSLFHSRAAFHDDFINQLENDSLDDWLWGRFKFLSGDDKSTWYSLLRWRLDMIYIPDVTVNSLETHSGSVTKRAYDNMRRWFGNMLRNSDRAIGLGPRTAGFFPWWCLLDQRISMWTSLITPGLLLLALLLGKWILAGLIISWVSFSRPLMLLIIFMGRPSHLKPIHYPILVATQWASAVIKVWNQMNMAKQSWNNRGVQGVKVQSKGMVHTVQVNVARFAIFTQTIAFTVMLLWFWFGILTPVQDIGTWWVKQQAAAEELTTQVIEATEYSILPNDNQDDAEKLQALIDNSPKTSRVQINLPLGELDLSRPLQISRSHLILRGQDAERTILQARFEPSQNNAFIIVQPSGDQIESLKDIQLRGFTLRSAHPSPTAKSHQLDGVVLKNVVNAEVKQVDLITRGRPVILDQTEDIQVEYVTVRGTMTPPVDLQQPYDAPVVDDDSFVMKE
jgi:glycosyltransferase Alg8